MVIDNMHQPQSAAHSGLPSDYIERVYAGVLGKIIGVYLGRPFEGWTFDRILAELGEIRGYVHERFNAPLVVTDDDISGTFTFVRALEDHGYPRDLSSYQVGRTWLNYTVEGRSIFWWGGLGNSAEHTAYLRLKAGIDAPHSGSSALNGKVISEQIGAQIFIDGFGLVAPGQPELAARLAASAARVSHDGEAVYAAQVIAVMLAMAFVEPDLDRLLDAALGFIPDTCLIARVIGDVRGWHKTESDWRTTFAHVRGKYGYDRYGGVCHVVPNHAVVILGLLYGEGDFHRTMTITNTCGWDTDCNAATVGCLLGVKNGLAGLEGGPDWRGPVADRLYLSSADPARGISDALTESYHIANAGRALLGIERTAPKAGARFHFSLPGAVQGFRAEGTTLTLTNVPHGPDRALRLQCAGAGAARAATPTFIPREALPMTGYALLASPTLHSGQTVRAVVCADAANVGEIAVALYLRYYDQLDQDALLIDSAAAVIRAGERCELTWRVPDLNGQPIFEIGLELRAAQLQGDALLLESLDWAGAPSVTLRRNSPERVARLTSRAWVDAAQQWEANFWPESYRVVQNSGRGLIAQGNETWRDYRASATLMPALSAAFGLAVRVRGLRHYYALLLTPSGARLVRMRDQECTLAEIALSVKPFEPVALTLEVSGARLRATIDGRLVFDVVDAEPLLNGGVAIISEDGTVSTDAVTIAPVAAATQTETEGTTVRPGTARWS